MPRLGELSAEKGADTDQRVLEAYQMQCVAEAQEGQNRVICVADLNHNDLLIFTSFPIISFLLF